MIALVVLLTMADAQPAPRCQGFHWDWPGFWNWYDARTPRAWHYHHYSSRRSDLLWTINQVRFAAEYGSAPGELKVSLGTVTPYFESFQIRQDGQAWRKAGAEYEWKLHPGKNRLELRARNTSGIEGPVSFLELEYQA